MLGMFFCELGDLRMFFRFFFCTFCKTTFCGGVEDICFNV